MDKDSVWIGSRGVGRMQAEYDKLMEAMSTPEYVEMMETFALK